MTDRELLEGIKAAGETTDERRDLEDILWKRYDRLVHKNWAVLRRQLQNSSLILEQEGDYYSEAYIAFTKAIDAVKLTKIRDDNWKFLGYFRLYLKNVRTSFLRQTINYAKNNRSLVVSSDSSSEWLLCDIATLHVNETLKTVDPLEEVVRRESERRCEYAIGVCLAKWDDTRKLIYSLREEGLSRKAVAEELGVHPATITYYLASMKKDMVAALESI